MKKEIIEVADLTLDEWLSLLKTNPFDVLFADYEFPTRKHRDEYIKSIASRTDEEVFFLLRKFLITNGALGNDESGLFNIKYKLENGFKLKELDLRRYIWAKTKGKFDPWEGITWVIDLLPHNPRLSLDVLDAYFEAHCMDLPDGRLIGLEDAKSIIRSKFILEGDIHNSEKVIEKLSWRELELLSANLYKKMGFDVFVTKKSNDGGRDVVATQERSGSKIRMFIECKKHKRKIGVAMIRELSGTVHSEKFNKGTLITSSFFTKGAKDFAANNNIELIDRNELKILLNEYLGRDWCINIDHHLSE